MKIRAALLIVIIPGVLAAVYFSFQRQEHPLIPGNENKQVKMKLLEVENRALSKSYEAEGIVIPVESRNVIFAVSGLLEHTAMDLREGMRFRKNQLLYQVNNREAFREMLAAKEKLEDKLSQLLPEISSEFPSENSKWKEFIISVEPGKLLPSFPELKSVQEKKWIEQKGIAEDYNRIKKYESGMSDYFYLAPFDGKIVEVYFEPGETIIKGQAIAKITSDNKKVIRVEIPAGVFESFDTIHRIMVVCDGKSENTQILRKEKIKAKESLFSVYLTVDQNVAYGKKVSIKLTGYTEKIFFRVPVNTVKHGEIMVFENDKIQKKPVSFVGDDSDSLYISGMKNGEQLILNR